MNFCEIIYSVFLVYNLCQWSVSNADSVFKDIEPPVVITKRILKGNATYFVTTTNSGSDVTQEACECVIFHNCNEPVNYLDDSNSCPSMHMCCKVPLIDLNLTEATTINPEASCQCVHKLKCELVPKNNMIEIESPSCVHKDAVCCPNAQVIPQLQCGERQPKANLGVDELVSRDSSTTDFGEFPFMASVWDSNGQFVCGASLLSDKMVLTVAHHVDGKDKSTLIVRVGDYDISSDGQTAEETAPYQKRSVSYVIIHPNYIKKRNKLVNDVAIMITADSFQLDSHISPVCSILHDLVGSEVYNSSNCLALGWGKLSRAPKGGRSDKLKKVDMKLVPFDECQKELRTTGVGPSFNLSLSALCAGGEKDLDTCPGDGGGPLVCLLHSNPLQYVQVGITSWGVGCGGAIPGVYESLEAHEAWISSTYDRYITNPSTPSGTDDSPV